jgi:hypothetical protein
MLLLITSMDGDRDVVEALIKRARDGYTVVGTVPEEERAHRYYALDRLLDDYRLHADTPLADPTPADGPETDDEREQRLAAMARRLADVDPKNKAREIRVEVERRLGGQLSPDDVVTVEETFEEIIAAAKRGEAIE